MLWLLKRFSLFVLALASVCLLVWLVLVLINLRDEAPSEITQRYLSMDWDRAVLLEEDNAVEFFAGLDAARDVEPRELGHDWFAWANVASDQEVSGPQGPGLQEYQNLKPLMRACALPRPDCQAMLEGPDAPNLQQQLFAAQWAVQRYARLLEYSHWREPGPQRYDVILDYTTPVQLSTLYRLHALQVSRQGDLPSSLALLDRDVRFWRLKLAQSSHLLGRMIAHAMLLHNLHWTHAVLQQSGASLPEHSSWRSPMTEDELSGSRGYVGEMTSMRASMDISRSSSNQTLTDRILALLGRSLFKPVATLNLYAAHFHQAEQAMRQPLDTLPETLARLQLQRVDEQAGWQIYNPIGAHHASQSHAQDFLRYAVRVSDLEGLRKMLLLADQLRSETIDNADRARWIEQSSLRNPYTEMPFDWNPDAAMLSFDGLSERDPELLRLGL